MTQDYFDTTTHSFRTCKNFYLDAVNDARCNQGFFVKVYTLEQFGVLANHVPRMNRVLNYIASFMNSPHKVEFFRMPDSILLVSLAVDVEPWIGG